CMQMCVGCVCVCVCLSVCVCLCVCVCVCVLSRVQLAQDVPSTGAPSAPETVVLLLQSVINYLSSMSHIIHLTIPHPSPSLPLCLTRSLSLPLSLLLLGGAGENILVPLINASRLCDLIFHPSPPPSRS